MLADLPLRSLREHGVDGLIGGKHLVEVGDVKYILRQFWLEVRLDLLIHQLVYVYVSEPRVLHYLVDSTRVADTLLGVLLQALVDEVLALFGHGYAVLFGVGEENWLCFY